MTSDHDALLRAICENPREDTPRLAFADWLEEHGEPDRAAFIRTDIAMSLRDEWDAERLRWEESLPPKEWERWHGVSPLLPGWVGPKPRWHGIQPQKQITFRRGFPSAADVSLLGEFFHDAAAALLARHPVEYFVFRGLPQMSRLVAAPWFGRLTGLQWSAGNYSAQTVRLLMDDPRVALAELAAFWHALLPDGLRAVFGARRFSQLTRLSLVSIGPQIARSLLDALTHPPETCGLRSLKINGDGINRDLLLLACSLPESLRILDLSGTRINSAQVREFAGAKAVSGLRMLTLSGNALGNDGGTALFTSPHLAGLKVLVLQYCQIGDDALRALLENSPLADGLNLLDLTGSPASGDMKEAVKARMGDRVRV